MTKTHTLLHVLVAGAPLAFSSAACFSADEDTLVLRGIVEERIEVGVQPEPIATALDLSVAADDVLIAHVTERANTRNGYSVTLSSENGGVLRPSSPANTDVVPYSLRYQDQRNITLSDGDVVIRHPTATAADGARRSLAISYPQTPLAADAYGDTITVTIAAQ